MENLAEIYSQLEQAEKIQRTMFQQLSQNATTIFDKARVGIPYDPVSDPETASLLRDIRLISQKIDDLTLLRTAVEKVNSEPCTEKSLQSESSPEQTATGKDTSNPLKDSSFPKAMPEVQTSSKLVKPSDFSLRPNGFMGNPMPKNLVSKLVDSQESVQGIPIPYVFKDYYVVFNGPLPGIYTNWPAAQQATKNVSNVLHKKYKGFIEARTAADLYCKNHGLEPLKFYSEEATLQPKQPKRKVPSGELPSSSLKEADTPDVNIVMEDFMNVYKAARAHKDERFFIDHFFTTEKKNLSFYNFCECSDPEIVKDAYLCGLIKTIYPGPNLLEISLLPKEIRRNVKHFRRKCIKDPSKKIYLKFSSTIPRWGKEGEQVYWPHHHITMGVRSEEEQYQPSRQMEATLEVQDLEELAVQKIQQFIEKMFEFSKEDKTFVNLIWNRVLITSKSFKPLSTSHVELILLFQKRLKNHYDFGPHHPLICKSIEKKSVEYSCLNCSKGKRPKKDGHVEDSATTSSSSS
ncbi:inclusion body/transactivation factor [Lamium leaf distortion virus]|uniref:Transactivator/viroplasmin protein n=1 Tax=Lamium leaf distortion virus TaxID=515320 RepID=B2CXY6_9VIRU|nr:inclusion body/transactivation factor [Lamium leaf distortion virus]ACB69768.1 inclusion body/transactivation factor [Lamium leaf distortion virus]